MTIENAEKLGVIENDIKKVAESVEQLNISAKEATEAFEAWVKKLKEKRTDEMRIVDSLMAMDRECMRERYYNSLYNDAAELILRLIKERDDLKKIDELRNDSIKRILNSIYGKRSALHVVPLDHKKTYKQSEVFDMLINARTEYSNELNYLVNALKLIER